MFDNFNNRNNNNNSNKQNNRNNYNAFHITLKPIDLTGKIGINDKMINKYKGLAPCNYKITIGTPEDFQKFVSRYSENKGNKGNQENKKNINNNNNNKVSNGNSHIIDSNLEKSTAETFKPNTFASDISTSDTFASDACTSNTSTLDTSKTSKIFNPETFKKIIENVKTTNDFMPSVKMKTGSNDTNGINNVNNTNNIAVTKTFNPLTVSEVYNTLIKTQKAFYEINSLLYSINVNDLTELYNYISNGEIVEFLQLGDSNYANKVYEYDEKIRSLKSNEFATHVMQYTDNSFSDVIDSACKFNDSLQKCIENVNYYKKLLNYRVSEEYSIKNPKDWNR